MRALSRCCCLVLCLAAAEARAATFVSYAFSATVRDVQNTDVSHAGPAPAIAPGIGPGTSLFGAFTFNTDAINQDPPGTGVAFYQNAVYQAWLTIADWTAVQASSGPGLMGGEIVASNTAGTHGEYLSSNPVDLTNHFTDFTMALEMSSLEDLWPNEIMNVPSLLHLDPYGLQPSTPWGYGTDLYLVGTNAAGLRMEVRAQLTTLGQTGVATPPPGTTGDASIFHPLPEPGLTGLVGLVLAGFALRSHSRRL